MSEEKEHKVSYRLSNEEYDTMSRIADLLHKKGALKLNSVSALAKAACFTQINIFLGFEQKERLFQEWQKKEKAKGQELLNKQVLNFNEFSEQVVSK